MQAKGTYVPWLILIGLMLTWGSSFILIKQGLKGFDQDSAVVGALRIIITFTVLLPAAAFRTGRVMKKHWIPLIAVGLTGNAAPAFLFAYAQTGIDSNTAGILNSLTPLFTLLIGLMFFRLKPGWLQIAGIMAGLGGAVGLIHFSGEGGFVMNFNFAVFVLIATICYATSVNIIKVYLAALDPVSITSFSFLFIGPPVILYLFLFTDFTAYMAEGGAAWAGLGYIAILAVVGTALALVFFNTLIKMTSALFAASVTYMIPIVAILWGIIDGESFSWNYIIWIILILGGVYMVNTSGRRNKKNI